MPVTMALDTLSGCSGCDVSFLNAGEGFLRLLQKLEIVHMPLLMDNKYFEYNGEGYQISIPSADIGVISGAIRNEEQLRIAEKMRKKCGIVLALGDMCRLWRDSGPDDFFEDNDLFRRYYRTAEATDAAPNPTEVLPPFLDRTYALDEKIRVDAWLPGCPPHPDNITGAFETLMRGEIPVLLNQSVCDSCPAKREGKGRCRGCADLFGTPGISLRSPWVKCAASSSRDFSAWVQSLWPAAPGARRSPPLHRSACAVPGCYGPVKRGGNQLLDMLNALASNGIDIRNLPDRLSVLRFSGAHGRLRRTVQKPV